MIYYDIYDYAIAKGITAVLLHGIDLPIVILAR